MSPQVKVVGGTCPHAKGEDDRVLEACLTELGVVVTAGGAVAAANEEEVAMHQP